MSCQIKSVVLYKEGEEPRTVKFKTGVNIVSGDPNTGKSTLIHIIDYCLGQTDFRIYEGITRQTVDWYAVLLQIGDTQAFIAKPSPLLGDTRTPLTHFETGAMIPIPPLRNLGAEYKDQEVSRELFKLLEQDRVEDPELIQVYEDLEIGVDKTLFYLFQEKTVIANNQVLFHRQRNNSDIIKQTLPFFLGVRGERDLKAEQQLRHDKEKASSLRTELAWERKRFSLISKRRQNLVAEAQEVGLLEDDFSSEDPDDIDKALEKIAAQWEPDTPPPIEDNRIPRLQDEINELRRQLDSKEWEVQSAKSLIESSQGYSRALEEQRMRLESVNLLPSQVQEGLFNDICPLCHSELDTSPPQVSTMRAALSDLKEKLAEEEPLRPNLHAAVSKLEEEKSRIKQKIREKEAKVRLISEEKEAKKDVIQGLFLRNVKIERIIGRIQMYLEMVEDTSSITARQERLSEIEERIKYYEEQYDPERIERREKNMIGGIGRQMSKWAEDLHMEHQGDYQLDLEKLSVVVDTSQYSIYMEQMGGRSNWLGCHLIALLALHKHFIERSRPVPNFLILDQPTQGYFPSSDEYKQAYTHQMRLGETTTSTTSQRAIREMFEFLFNVCDELVPDFQLIILERAYIEMPRFRQALVDNKRWEPGYALIPQSWFN